MTAHGEGEAAGASRSALAAWCVYDWANSAVPTVVVTFVFSAYFTTAVASSPIEGTAIWGYAMSLTALAVAVAGPVFGAIADHGGRRKPWLFVFTAISVFGCAMLYGTRPDPADVVWGLAFAIVANFAFETGQVFYNAMLPSLAPRAMMGRISGWGWGLGYAGGLSCLVLAFVGFVDAETPWFGVLKEDAGHVRATMVLVAVWFAVFSVPIFLFTPDAASGRASPIQAVREGLATLLGTLRRIREYEDIARFLLARMIYTDGLNTLFAFGGIYAAGTFGMDISEIILFGIAMNVTAGLGAFAFAWVDDYVGPKPTILISLACLTVLGGVLLVVEGKFWFWVVALPLGIFIGPAQSASRSLMARMVPRDMANEMFGLYALSGKATAFIGPALLAWATTLFDSQRVGMGTILIFFAVGGILLALWVRDPPR